MTEGAGRLVLLALWSYLKGTMLTAIYTKEFERRGEGGLAFLAERGRRLADAILFKTVTVIIYPTQNSVSKYFKHRSL